MPRLEAAVAMLVLSAMLGLVPGCASTGLLNIGKQSIPEASRDNPVLKIVALWDPAEGPGLDGKTCRGFIGRVMFFTGRDKLPAKVNGGLQIYMYDDQGSREQQIKPIHEFYKSATDLASCFQATELGATYAVFVPYPKRGGHKVNCAIRLRYVPIDEQTGKENHQSALISEMAYVTLPGPAAPQQSKASKPVAEKPPEPELKVESLKEIAESARKQVKRPAAVPLTDSERERILAEVRGEQRAPAVSGHREDELSPVPPARLPRRHVLMEPEDIEPVESHADESSSRVRTVSEVIDEGSDPFNPPSRKLSHPLSTRWTEAEKTDDSAQVPAPVPSADDRREPSFNSRLDIRDLRDDEPIVPAAPNPAPAHRTHVLTSSEPEPVAPGPAVATVMAVGHVGQPTVVAATSTPEKLAAQPADTVAVPVETAAAPTVKPAEPDRSWLDKSLNWLSGQGFTLNTLLVAACLIVAGRGLRKCLSFGRQVLRVWRKLAVLLRDENA